MTELLSPPTTQKRLFAKYSASQVYFYPSLINQIVKERRSNINIFYEDVEYFIDLEENLKRWYHAKEFDSKMFTFKEYYFYHQDCPRIFMRPIEDAYARWQDKKRDLVYKKLKLIYNQSYSSSVDSHGDEQNSQNPMALSHFLLQISDYNPYSKKYYLRTEAKREKERKRVEEEKRNHSRRDLEHLQHQLSAMLNDLSTLSQISTLNSPAGEKEKERPKGKLRSYVREKYEEISKSNSTNLSNSNSLIKFSFKKNKDSADRLIQLKEFNTNKSNSREKDSAAGTRLSPKMADNHISSHLFKTKSIFTVSSFGVSKNQELRHFPAKKEPLKIHFDSRRPEDPLKRDQFARRDQPPRKNQPARKEQLRKFQTEKKKESSLPKTLSIKVKSVSKLQKRGSMEKAGSVGKLLKYDQFSDKKMGEGHNEFRMRSLKSEFVGGNRKELVRPTLQLQRGKRVLELKNR